MRELALYKHCLIIIIIIIMLPVRVSELDFSNFLYELYLEGPGFSWMSPDISLSYSSPDVDLGVFFT